jgi:hypothetical protein
MGNHGNKVEIDTSKGYQKNEIQLGGIVITTVALILVSAVAFFLMWILQARMDSVWTEADKANASPIGLKPDEKLPPEPRLQSAPGFGVDSPNGRINLELKNPQAEWEELKKLWAKEEKEGQKAIDPKTKEEKTVTMPIAEAKKKLLEQNVKAVSAEDGKKNLESANDFYSSASSGRMASEVRR